MKHMRGEKIMKYYAIFTERGKATEEEIKQVQSLPFIKVLNVVQTEVCIITFESEEPIYREKLNLNKNWYVGKKVL